MTCDEWLESLPEHDFEEIAALEIIERFAYLEFGLARNCEFGACRRHGLCLSRMVRSRDEWLPVPFTQWCENGLRPLCQFHLGRIDYPVVLQLKRRLRLETDLLEHPFLMGNRLLAARAEKREARRAGREPAPMPVFSEQKTLACVKEITACLRGLNPRFRPATGMPNMLPVEKVRLFYL
jgi:hypothetical protein